MTPPQPSPTGTLTQPEFREGVENGGYKVSPEFGGDLEGVKRLLRFPSHQAQIGYQCSSYVRNVQFNDNQATKICGEIHYD